MATIFPKKALYSTLDELSQSNKPLTIVFGSPMTMPDSDGGPGVPGVEEIIKKIEKLVKDKNKSEDYEGYVKDTTGGVKYQKSFEFVNGWINQETSNKIIEDAVIEGCGILDGKIQHYPESLNNIAKVVNSDRIKINSIITTNFDPLLELCFDKNNIDYQSYTLSGDGSLPRSTMSSKNNLNIYHIHGFWRGDDTLHTDEQLTSERAMLSASIEEVIGETSVLVIAYGGWDDVFLNSLKKSLNHQKIKANIMWCFFEIDPAKVNNNNTVLFDKLSKGLNGNKVRFYCDINCKFFFNDLLEYFNAKYDFPDAIDRGVISEANSTITHNILDPNYLSTASYIENDVQLKRSFLENRPHHSSIRARERQLTINELMQNKVVSLNSILGGEKNGFLGSVIFSSEQLKSLPIYRVDLNNINTSEALHSQFKKDIGINIAPFISIHSKDEKCILILDNISDLDLHSWKEQVSELINTIKINSILIYTLLIGDATLEFLTYSCVEIGALDNPDLYTYLYNHPGGREDFFQNENFRKISQFTQNLPEKIDSLLHELRLETIDDYFDNIESSEVYNGLNPVYGFDEILPKSVQELIYDYSISDKKENYDCYTILKTLAILEYGETFRNIKSYYSDYNLNQKSFHRLIDIGLITLRNRVITLKREYRPSGKIIMTINPLVSSFIKKQLDEKEVNKLVQQGLELSLGINWKSGTIKINASVKEQILESHSYGPGNVHSLLCMFMKYAVREQKIRDFKSVFYASLWYIDFLYQKGRFNDVVLSAQDIYQICQDFDEIIEPYKLLIRKAEGLRITGRFEEAEFELSKVEKYHDKLTNSEKISILVEKAYIKEHDNIKDEALQIVQQIKNLTPKKSDHWFTAEGIAAHFLSYDLRVAKLRRLEKQARDLGHTFVANNLSLTLASEIKDVKQKNIIYDKVIDSSKDDYTQIRALLRKGKSLVSLGQVDEIKEKERVKLKDTYIYLFTQRLEKMADSCHDILWEVYSAEGNLSSLLNLFRHSSIIWLLSGNTKRELQYLKQLNSNKEKFTTSECSNLYEELIASRSGT